MRIAQMTWYRSSNYGSVLQAYALQRTLESLDVQTELVNYDPAPYQQRNQSKLRKSRPWRVARETQQRLIGEAPFKSAAKNAAFSEFQAKHMRETAPIATEADFRALNESFDAFVCGSDQIWSPRCFDPRYFLDFVAPDRRRVAYAPSFGCDELPEDAAAAMAPLVTAFDSLSSREETGARMVERLSGRPCPVVADPVALLSRTDWESVADVGVAPNAPYCLCYFLGRSKENWAHARATAKARHLDLVTVPVFNGDARREGAVPEDVGPEQFLGLVSRATHVCTDSFHGLVFATIFERDVTAYERFKAGTAASQNVRIESYLNATGLQDCIVRRNATAEPADPRELPIAYRAVRRRIDGRRTASLDYLRTALGLLTSQTGT